VKPNRLFFARCPRGPIDAAIGARDAARTGSRSCENAIRRCLKRPFFVSPRCADHPPGGLNARPAAANVEINQGTFDETWSEQQADARQPPV
jgi:hypothetical protein